MENTTRFEACELDESPRSPVTVRGRPFLAGSGSAYFPETIPSAAATLRAVRVEGAGPLAALAQACRKLIDAELPRSGQLLLRGLPLADAEAFNRFFGLLDYQPFSYNGGIAVRDKTAEFIYEASQEPADVSMTPHNEMAYLRRFPGKVFFFCETAAAEGGEVPVNDIRATTRLLAPDVAEQFRSLGIRYTRLLAEKNDQAEIGWRQTFQVSDRSGAEAVLRDAGFDFAWQDNGDLAYSYAMPAFIRHSSTGEELWFNQATELHGSYWLNHPVFHHLGWQPEQCPANTAFGDGSAIPADTIDYLRGLIWQTSQFVRMQAGDILILDNTFIQHGRMSYVGYRRHVVSLAY